MNKILKGLLSAVAIVSLIVSAALADTLTITNRGQVITVTVSSGTPPEGSTTVETDQSVWPTPTDRRGIYVDHYEQAAGTVYAAGTHDTDTWEIPDGVILQADGIIEVQTAMEPSWATNSISVGGVTILANGQDLQSTGLVTLDNVPAITTSDDEITLTLGAASSNGVFTIYLPVIGGNSGDRAGWITP